MTHVRPFSLLVGMLAAGALLGAAPAPRLAGTWHGERTFQRGTRSYTYANTYVLQVHGTTLTGLMLTNSDRREIVDGRVEGSHLSFGLRNPFVPESRAQAYTGEWNGDTLTVTAVRSGRRGGGPGAGLVLHRVSDATVYQPPLALRHPPLPPLRTLPPNGMARTPPMGWNSWNKFHGSVNDADIRATADQLVSTGMRDAGYIYVNIDDTWEGQRDAQGNIQPNAKFPDMKALADYVHARGLKLGIYSSPGPKTCAGYEGSYLHEAQDARTYAAWGIDYLKYDWCSASLVYGPDEMKPAYEQMALALRATGRPMVFSLCQYGWLDVGQWGAEVGGNLWRTTGDISDNYASMARNGFSQNGRQAQAGPGHWNDPDMLEIGNGGMSDTEYRTHMSLWSLLAAPLLAGNDLRSVSPDIMAILTNKEVIAIDQDRLGHEADRVSKKGDLEVWARPLADGSHAVGLFNRGPETAKVTARWSDVGIHGSHKVRDLWAHTDRGAESDEYSAEVPSHGVALVKVSR
ncbi:MAG: glycoside hydrolase family 27 protein [Terriglobales bacterium]